MPGNWWDWLNPVGTLANLAIGVGQTAWNIFAQNKTWDREDQSIARKVADLRSQGLSPTLAAGSGAQTSSPINIGRPEFDTGQFMQNMIAGKQVEMLGAQIDKIKAETEYLTESMPDRLRKVAYDVDYMGATLQDRIAYVGERLSGQELRNSLTRVDTELRRHQVNTESWRPAAEYALKVAAGAGAGAYAWAKLDHEKQELLIKQQMLELATDSEARKALMDKWRRDHPGVKLGPLGDWAW